MSRSFLSSFLCLLPAMLAVLCVGCIGRTPANPAATQPVTVVDPATTQPSYWLGQPPADEVRTADFDATWLACKDLARDYLFELDREDYRSGLITTRPLVSKQIFEVWRPDTGKLNDEVANSLATIRRTLRFEVSRDLGNLFTVTPKVLVERETIVERRVTSVVQYRTAFSGPRSDVRYAVRAEGDPAELPAKYWYPIGRDTEMEKQVARRLRRRLDSGAVAAPETQTPAVTVTPIPGALASDGVIANVGASQTIYIDLGSADKIVPGMTFEVYDARATVPPVEHFGLENPGSKGWIEVVTVARSSSTCRIIRKSGVSAIARGDLLFNFIYDRKGENRFALAGDFETPDRETLSGLIWRWNGIVEEKIGAGTKFLIAGKPPKNAAEKPAYEAARAKATELKISIVDEERFNLLIRYYDPAKR